MQPSDVLPLQSLWLSCFHEQENAAALFFNRNLSDTHGYVAAHNGVIIAAVYLIDCTLRGMPAHYLCGAATLPAFRGRGVMSELLEFALGDAAARGDCCSVLLPADAGLYDFYAARGYQVRCAVCHKVFSTGGAAAPVSGTPDWNAVQQASGGSNALLWQPPFLDFARQYYACYGAASLQTAHAFAIFEQEGDRAEVFYAAYDSFSELKGALAAKGIRRFGMTGSADNPDFAGSTPQVCGMLRPLQQNRKLPGNVFIGITLD